ncbi:hypothetical protein, partial [Bacillus pseudomycoides]|uniref:hypothetical protein n=1 Tax=Bacillus pseudomycoides TaxID=64104 RepID=UPI001C37BFBD
MNAQIYGINNFTTNNDNYVNELSIWTAYCIFLLSVVFFQNAGGIPNSKKTKISHPGYFHSAVVCEKN